jgi:uncharacterized repeat protein (TIGR03803 family)
VPSQIFPLTNKTLLVSFLLLALVSLSLARDRERTLYTFPGGIHGEDPQTGVVSDSEGNLYGTTYYGGIYGWGTVFELKHSEKSWSEEVIYNFLGSHDGFNPSDNLLIDKAGNLYGDTFYGGTGTGCQNPTDGCGTVYELKRTSGSWKKTVIYNFCSLANCRDGANPYGMTFDKVGNIYGTAGGGVGCESICGVVYELRRSEERWIETVLHEFTDTNGDGFSAEPGVSLDEAGNVYGTTCCGGANNYGIVFELKLSNGTWHESILYSFTGATNDRNPNGYLTVDAGANVYGTTTGGGSGCEYQCGAIFELSRFHGRWVKTVLYTFNGDYGASPNAPLVLDNAGALYGSTLLGGASNDGVVFKLQHDETWKITVLHSFSGNTDGADPYAGLIFGVNGALYGTTLPYESQYGGTVFQVSPK